MNARHWGNGPKPSDEEYNEYVTLFGEEEYDEDDESYAYERSRMYPEDDD